MSPRFELLLRCREGVRRQSFNFLEIGTEFYEFSCVDDESHFYRNRYRLGGVKVKLRAICGQLW